MNTTPLEYDEQVAFVHWLELNNLLFTATAQSTYTTSFNQKRRNYALGVRKGLQDVLVYIDGKKSINGQSYLLFIEMKRIKGGVLSAEQKIWRDSITMLNVVNVQSFVCKGSIEAITTVSYYLKHSINDIF